MKYPHIKNWKLREIQGDFKVVSENSIPFIEETLLKLKLPLPNDANNGLYREDTIIDWSKMPRYHKFFFDRKNYEIIVKKWLEKSTLNKYDKVIIPYRWDEPTIEISTNLFIGDWEGFIRSTLWETIIFSDDYKLIMEVSRDYYLHSNFEIMPNSKVF